MQKKLLIVTILLALLLTGCSAGSKSGTIKIPKTYEAKVKYFSDRLNDIRSEIPDPNYPIRSPEDFDYKQNTKNIKNIYNDVKALKPTKELEAAHKQILRDLSFAVEGAELLESANKKKDKSLYAQAIILITLNIDDVGKITNKN